MLSFEKFLSKIYSSSNKPILLEEKEDFYFLPMTIYQFLELLIDNQTKIEPKLVFYYSKDDSIRKSDNPSLSDDNKSVIIYFTTDLEGVLDKQIDKPSEEHSVEEESPEGEKSSIISNENILSLQRIKNVIEKVKIAEPFLPIISDPEAHVDFYKIINLLKKIPGIKFLSKNPDNNELSDKIKNFLDSRNLEIKIIEFV